MHEIQDTLPSLEWTSISGFSCTYPTHKLKREGQTILKFIALHPRVPGTNIGIFVMFVYCALNLSFILGLNDILLQLIVGAISLTMLLTSFLVFKSVISHLLTGGHLNKEIIFNLSTKEFYFNDFSEQYNPDKKLSLYSAEALQLMKKTIVNYDFNNCPTNTYNCYELNFVFKGSTRINILAHGAYKQIKEDAEILANNLGITLIEGNESE